MRGQACEPVFSEEGTRCGTCEALWSASRQCRIPKPAPTPSPARPVSAAPAALPDGWHDNCVTVDEVTGCWLWTGSDLPASVARKLIARRAGTPRASRQECERDGCVSPLHAGPIKGRGVGS